MLEIASYKYNYWQVNRACQIRSVHHNQWGDCFWLGGTSFGCQNWSGEPFFLQKSVRGDHFWGGADFGVTVPLCVSVHISAYVYVCGAFVCVHRA